MLPAPIGVGAASCGGVEQRQSLTTKSSNMPFLVFLPGVARNLLQHHDERSDPTGKEFLDEQMSWVSAALTFVQMMPKTNVRIIGLANVEVLSVLGVHERIDEGSFRRVPHTTIIARYDAAFRQPILATWPG